MSHPRIRTIPFLLALVAGCSGTTDPVSENTAKSFTVTDQGIVVPDDGSIVAITGMMTKPPPPRGVIDKFPNLASSVGYFGMTCTSTVASRRCTLLWIGATATTAVALATCASGIFTAGCAGAIIAASYTWDQFFMEPNCRPCAHPFSYLNRWSWTRSGL